MNINKAKNFCLFGSDHVFLNKFRDTEPAVDTSICKRVTLKDFETPTDGRIAAVPAEQQGKQEYS